MERECQEECVLIHFDLLRETIDRYLKKHSFCDECTKMVNKAYTLLVTDDEESECCDSTAPKCCGHETPNQNQSSQCKGMYRYIQCGKFSNFTSLRFSVKPMSEILEVQKLHFSTCRGSEL